MVKKIISEEQAEKSRERNKLWYQANKERVSEKKKEYYRINKDSIDARKKLHYDANKETKLKYQQEYYESNRNLILAKKRDYYKKNPDKARVWEFKRRALKKGARVEISIDWEFILLRDNNICYLCNEIINDDLHYDHRIPLSRGGSHSTDNIFMTHAKCNLKKGSKLWEEFNGLG